MPDRRSLSPSILSETSEDGAASEHDANNRNRGGSSSQLRTLFDSFQSAKRFSQFESAGGRGQRQVAQATGLLHHIWGCRDIDNPEMCMDKHDGRAGLRIYKTPIRGPGGVIQPCTLAGIASGGPGQGERGSFNIINNHVTVSAASSPLTNSSVGVREIKKAKPKLKSSASQKMQLTFAAPKRILNSSLPTKGERGRFTKKKLVSVQSKRGTAPSIPLNTRGLRALLQQWVIGDDSRGLLKPLAEFNIDERNGRDATGKDNKSVYYRRRRVALATLLALQDAYENNVSFPEAIGLEASIISKGSAENNVHVTMSAWERTAKQYLGKCAGKLSDSEIVSLGKKVYRSQYTNLLPEAPD